MNIFLFTIVLFIGMSLPAHSQTELPLGASSPIQQVQSRINQVLTSPAIQEFGYPLNDRKSLVNPLTLSIAERVIEIKSTFEGLEKDEGIIWNIIGDNLPSFNQKTVLQGIWNDGALAREYPDIRTDLLFAAILLSSHQKNIYDVKSLLMLSNIHIGRSSEANGLDSNAPPSIYTRADIQAAFNQETQAAQTAKAPEGERLAFWPAAAAIIKHPTDSVPQLQSILADNKLSDKVRLHAASFLQQLDASSVSNEVLDSVGDGLRSKINCIQEHDIKWYQLAVDPCRLYSKEVIERWENFKEKRSQLLN